MVMEKKRKETKLREFSAMTEQTLKSNIMRLTIKPLSLYHTKSSKSQLIYFFTWNDLNQVILICNFFIEGNEYLS